MTKFPKWNGAWDEERGYNKADLVRYMLKSEKAKKEFVTHLEKLKKLYAVPTDASEIYRKPSQIIEKVLEAFK